MIHSSLTGPPSPCGGTWLGSGLAHRCPGPGPWVVAEFVIRWTDTWLDWRLDLENNKRLFTPKSILH